jgi:hypothetical protein
MKKVMGDVMFAIRWIIAMWIMFIIVGGLQQLGMKSSTYTIWLMCAFGAFFAYITAPLPPPPEDKP